MTIPSREQSGSSNRRSPEPTGSSEAIPLTFIIVRPNVSHTSRAIGRTARPSRRGLMPGLPAPSGASVHDGFALSAKARCDGSTVSHCLPGAAFLQHVARLADIADVEAQGLDPLPQPSQVGAQNKICGRPLGPGAPNQLFGADHGTEAF